MRQRLCCSFRPLLRLPFLPGSWPCLSINKAASFQTLPFPGQVSCQMLFLSGFEIDGWHLSSFAGSLKGSAAAFGRCYHSHFCRVPGHAWRLSCSSFQSRLLPNGFLSRFEIAGWHLSSVSGNPYMPQKLCCSFRPLFRSPFLPGSWPCLSIKSLASRLCLFLATSLAKWCFYRVSQLLDGTLPPFQETLICLKALLEL